MANILIIDGQKWVIDLCREGIVGVKHNISGVGLIAIIKKKFPSLPVIAITGWGEHPEALATEVQADQVLEKPFELSELETSLKKLLSSESDI